MVEQQQDAVFGFEVNSHDSVVELDFLHAVLITFWCWNKKLLTLYLAVFSDSALIELGYLPNLTLNSLMPKEERATSLSLSGSAVSLCVKDSFSYVCVRLFGCFMFKVRVKKLFSSTNGMCTIELQHGGWFENGVYKKSKQNLKIRYRNVEGGLELLTFDAKVVEFVGHIPSNKVIVGLVWNGDYDYDVDAENCGGDVTWPFIDELANNDFSQVKEVAYNEDEETFENVGTKVANEDAWAELPNQDVAANVTIDDEGAKLPNEDEDSEFKDSDYEFSEN
ncbi:unnamed protein product, partial [Prunus brigantina]